MPALTLAHYADVEQLAFKKYVILNILRQVKLAEVIPFENVSSLSNIAIRWKQLPTSAFRYINGGYSANVGDTEQVWESVYGFGGISTAEVKAVYMLEQLSIFNYRVNLPVAA